MKILALSDIHGANKVASEIIKREADADVVVISGDLTTHGTRAEAIEAIGGFRVVVPRILAIAGNMDSPDIDAGYAAEGMGLDGTGVVFGDAGFFGVSGGPKSFLHTPFERTEDELLAVAEQGWTQVLTARRKIFVPHAPPHGTKLDEARMGIHVGSTAIRTFVEQRQPDLLICGHIHESLGEDTLGKTRMVNCGSVREGRYVVVEIREGISIFLRQLNRRG